MQTTARFACPESLQYNQQQRFLLVRSFSMLTRVSQGAMSETGSENATDGAMPTSRNTIVPNPTDLGKRVVAFSAQGRKEQYYGTLR